MKSRIVWIVLLVLGLALAAALAFAGLNRTGEARAELTVEKMTCGACAQNIRQTLADLPGVGAVEVNVTAGRATVSFDPTKVDAGKIAGKITEAGYPAQVAQVLSAEEIAALNADSVRLAEKYVGRIGERLVSRDEFTAEVDRLRRGAPAGKPVPESQLRQTAWQEIVQRTLMLADAEGHRVVVQDGEVAREIARLRKETGDFEAVTAAFGGEAGLTRRVKEDLVINRNLEEHLFRGEADPARRQALADRWYRALTETHPVTVFDPVLKGSLQKSGGCGKCC